MSRYIDVELLKNKILEDMAKAECEGRDCNGYTDALFHLKTIPTADVVEVKHGEWFLGKYKCMDRSVCSVCNAVYEGGDNWNYCPCCGAKMDGGRREEE